MPGMCEETSEAVRSALCALYRRRGYSRYRMNQFEEYDLYAYNKDFLISDRVITFTDGRGKLLALKPDVTLSIVKNSRDMAGATQKLYYNESVYRVTKGNRNFKEIMQVGLECLGTVDDYCIYEVLKLALESLALIREERILSVSHLGLLLEVARAIGVPEAEMERMLRLVGEKNLHELGAMLDELGIPSERAALLTSLLKLQGDTPTVIATVVDLLSGVVREETLAQFLRVLSALKGESALLIDFSVVGDLHYYNGFVFKGFIEGIPTAVLSGGQYDMLMRKMGRKSDAIGFAVYLDMIEQWERRTAAYDVDTVLLYDKTSTPNEIDTAVHLLEADSGRVLAGAVLPEGLQYKKLVRIQNGRIKTLEDHA